MLSLAIGLVLVIGLLLGMLGGGGSVLMVPVLLYVLRLEPKSALLTSQLIMAVTCSITVVVHARAGRVVWRTGVLFGLAGMLGAYLGGRLARYVPGKLLLLGFTALMLLSALRMLRAQPARKRVISPADSAQQNLRQGAILGLPTGFVSGMLGIGGGFLIVPVLTLLGGLAIEEAVGTSLMIIAMQSLAGSVGYLGCAAVRWPIVAVLAMAMGLSSTFGGLLTHRLPAARLRRLFAGLLVVVAVLMLIKNLW